MEFFVETADFCGIMSKMAASCKGMCEEYKSQGITMKEKYQHGQKRCTYCGLFLTCKGPRCPCCKTILEQSPEVDLQVITEFSKNLPICTVCKSNIINNLDV